MRLKPLITGVSTYIPVLKNMSGRKTGGTTSAEYCYSVYLRHLVMAAENGLNTNPETIAELGPGDSIGIGLAALLCGAEKYYAFDVLEYANIEKNLSVFEQLLAMFRARKSIPSERRFPRVKPKLSDYSFPHTILDEHRMALALKPARIEKIRQAILSNQEHGEMIAYKVPWYAGQTIAPESVDMIFSQAVLEHVDDLCNAYSAMEKWLRPKGFVSHQIDFKCHGMFKQWNGHWACSAKLWKLIRGKRPYLLNRQPCSTHIQLLQSNNFSIVCQIPVYEPQGISRAKLAKEFRSISDQDFKTSGVFVQAQKH